MDHLKYGIAEYSRDFLFSSQDGVAVQAERHRVPSAQGRDEPVQGVRARRDPAALHITAQTHWPCRHGDGLVRRTLRGRRGPGWLQRGRLLHRGLCRGQCVQECLDATSSGVSTNRLCSLLLWDANTLSHSLYRIAIETSRLVCLVMQSFMTYFWERMGKFDCCRSERRF